MTGRKCPVHLQMHQQTHPLFYYRMKTCVNMWNDWITRLEYLNRLQKYQEQDHDTSLVEVGNWVLRKVNRSSPLWTGPYKVAEATSHCVKVWLTEDRLSNWIHKTVLMVMTLPKERWLRNLTYWQRLDHWDKNSIRLNRQLMMKPVRRTPLWRLGCSTIVAVTIMLTIILLIFIPRLWWESQTLKAQVTKNYNRNLDTLSSHHSTPGG